MAHQVGQFPDIGDHGNRPGGHGLGHGDGQSFRTRREDEDPRLNKYLLNISLSSEKVYVVFEPKTHGQFSSCSGQGAVAYDRGTNRRNRTSDSCGDFDKLQRLLDLRHASDEDKVVLPGILPLKGGMIDTPRDHGYKPAGIESTEERFCLPSSHDNTIELTSNAPGQRFNER